MSFRTKLKKNQEKTATEIKKSKVTAGYELCQSFNRKSAVNNDTKMIIVGTLTPPDGRKNGYFYSAPKNRVYNLLDNYFENQDRRCNLSDLKKELISKETSGKTSIVNQIINELQNHNIAFLDVIDFAIASKNSSKDDDILDFNLDYNTFQNVLSTSSDLKFVCTSQNAAMGLICILEKIGAHIINPQVYPISVKYNNKDFVIDLAPQMIRNSKYNESKIKNRQNHWNNILKQYI